MAKANLKARCKPTASIYIPVVLDKAPDNPQQPAFPWMKIANSYLESAGFLPGEHVLFSVNYIRKQITISVDYDHTRAGIPFNKP